MTTAAIFGGRAGDPSRGGHPLFQLTLVRFREFVREPEALFWVFLFPMLLAAGLGIAFRNRPAEMLQVAAVTPELARALRREKLLDVQELSVRPPRKPCARERWRWWPRPARRLGGLPLRRHQPRGTHGAHAGGRAIQRAAGRADPVSSSDRLMREPGSRYIDFLIPGLLGMNLMGSAIWGIGFAIVDARRKKLLKRLIATPMPRHYYLLSFLFSRLVLLVLEVGAVVGLRPLVFRRAPARFAAGWRRCACWVRCRSARWGC